MAPNSDDEQGAAGIFRDTLSQIMAATCLITVGTCISMWSTQRLIEQSIKNIVESDTEQTRMIDQLRESVNTLRVEQGIQRGRLGDMARRVGAL